MKTNWIFFLIILLITSNLALAQTPVPRGTIITPASPVINPMNPNGDTWVTTSTSGFSFDGDYLGEFELPMFGIPKVGAGEVPGDNVGSSCGITDLIPDKNGFSVYALRDNNNNLIFRFRVGANNPSVEAWTILLDVDGLFGQGKDPNATADNPGFELDLTLIKRNNAGVFIYNIDGTDKCGTPLLNFPIANNFQISVADEVSCGDPDYFYDFYVPFGAVAAAFNTSSGSNLSASTGLRYVAVTNVSATCAMDGKIADISGLDNDAPPYNNCNTCAFTAIIENQCPTAVNQLCNTCLGFNSNLPAKPTIIEPIRAGQTVITGTSGAGTYLKLSIFQRTGGTDAAPVWSSTPREEITVFVPVSAWSITLSSPLLAYDQIVARAQLTLDGSGCDAANGNTTSTSVTIVEPNVAPIADNQPVTVIEDIPKSITLVATDADNNPLTYTVLTQPVNGVLSGTAPNLIYTPNLNFNGSDSFTFRANDGVLNSNTATVSITVTAVNDAPVATNQSLTTPEDTALPITLSATDVDAGTTLSYSIVTPPLNGALSVVSGAGVTYTPNANYFGPDSFTFKANDGSIDSNIATISITVTPVNDAPVANNQSVTTPEDTPVSITLVGSDVDGNSLIYSIVSGPANGTLTGSGATRTYTPNANYNGPDSFTFKVNDGSVDSNIATVSITVTPVNDPPVATNQSLTTPEDTALPITLTATDVDAGAILIFSIVTPPANGMLSAVAGAGVTYTPNANFVGSDSFIFKANDGTANSNNATIFIEVTPVNDAPVANAQSVTLNEDASAAITLTGSDPDGDALTFLIVTGPANGTLTGTAPNLTYTPAANYNGSDSFTFKVNDGTVDSNIATVTITVNPVNDAPIANNQSVTTPEDTPVLITLTGSDIDGNTLTYSVVTPPQFGTLSGTAPDLTYTPNANYFGPDSFTFMVNDGTSDSNTATVTITVTPVNDAPLANNQSVTTPEDTPVSITLTGSDIDGNPLTYAVVTSPQFGTLSGTAPNLTYTPNANYFGPDNFTFRANDGTLNSNVATVSITVTPVNDAPVASNVSVTTPEDTSVGITLAGTDVEGSPLTYIIVSNPSNGTLTGTGSNRTYTPNANFNGTDTFTYKVNDGTSDSNTATVTITVTPVNDAPIANNQSVTTPEDTPVSITLTGSDIDGNPLTYTVIASPQFGMLSGTVPNLTYTPNAHYFGPDSFTFRVNDGTVNSNVATVSITVTPVNDPPVASNVTVTTPEDTAVGITLAGTDVEGSPLTYIIVSNPSNGTLTGTGPNRTYIPNTNFNGTDTFTYKVNDGTSDSNTATVTITVTPVNDAPVTFNMTVSYDLNTPVNFTLNAIDADGNPLTYTILTTPANGTLSGTAPNLTYTPDSGFNLTNTMTFKVNDGTVDSNIATVTFVFNNLVNDPPVAEDQTVIVIEDQNKNITLTATDPDPGDVLTFTIVTPPSNGTLSGTAPNLTYTPAANYTGPDSFTFKASDGTLDSNIGTISITVTPVNDAPIANNQSVMVVEDVATAITLTGSDVEGSVLTFTVVTLPTQGTLSGTGASLTYTPNVNYNGPDSFTFTVSDGSLTSSAATISITIIPANDAPVANSQSVTTNEDTPAAITLTGSDIDLDALTFTIVTPPANGTLSGTAPNVTYTPAANYNGPDSFTFKVNDGTVDSNIATVSITVTPVNDAPVANNQSVMVVEDIATAIILTGSDVEGSVLTFTVMTSPTQGTLSGTGASLTYTPNVNFNGPDSFTFKVNDGTTDSNTATVSITVVPANDAPVANNQSVTTNEDTPATITLTGSDIDLNALTYTIVTPPANGTLSGTAPNVTYTPSANYNGPDSFTFKVNDGTVDSNIATVSITVTPVNDVPVANNQSVTVVEDVAKGITLTGNDVEGSVLTFTVVTSPTQGILSGTGASLTYTPNANYNGPDSFTFKVNDGTTDSNTATVSITVVPVNDSPVAYDQTITTPEDTPSTITLTGSDIDLNALTYTIVTPPANGTLSGTAPNVTYRPAANYNGPDSFTFKVNDGTVDSNIATVSITVTPVNDAPIANNQSVTVVEDVAKGITLTGSDVEGSALTFTVVTSPTNGTLSGTGASLTYTPNANYNGPDTFTFKVNDGTTDSNVATVSINVVPENDPPVAINDAITTLEDLAVTFNITNNDVDIDGIINASTVDLDPTTPAEDKTFSVAGQGTYGVDNTGNVTFTPVLNYNGTATPVVYTVKDNSGALSNTASIQVTVTPVNDAPVVQNKTVIVNEDQTTSVCFTVTDIENDPSVFTGAVSVNGNGSLVLDPATGQYCFKYTPNPNFNGQDVVNVTVCDANDPSLCSTGTITINIIPVNDPPRILVNSIPTIKISVSTLEDAPLNFCFDADDIEGDIISLGTITNVSGGGSLVAGISGVVNQFCFLFSPAQNFTGKAVWEINICDDGVPSECGKITIEIDVTPVNDAPVANNQTATVLEDTPKIITLGATDIDGDALTYTIVTNPTRGVLSGSGANITYTPNLNYTGNDSFTFKVNDGLVDSNVATVTITVTPVNDAPKINPIPILSVAEDTELEVCLGVTDVDGDNIIYNQPTNISGGGTMTLSTSFNFCFVFKPVKDFNGNSFWKFRVCDNGNPSLCAEITVQIVVTPVNDPPVAVNDFIEAMSFVMTAPVNILANDRDIENDGLILTTTPVSGPFHGTVTMKADGTFEYKSNLGFIGSDSVRYRVCDTGVPSLCDEGVVFIEVAPAPFKIYNGLSPNGDNLNDYWRIDGIETYPNNRVRVFDRFNNLIFETTGYNNDNNSWRGQANHSMMNGSNMSEGTYFYSVDLGDGSKLYSGYVVLKKN